jgi:hypothetical protein
MDCQGKVIIIFDLLTKTEKHDEENGREQCGNIYKRREYVERTTKNSAQSK